MTHYNDLASKSTLLVDFETGLSRTDITFERALAAIRSEPLRAIKIFISTMRGRKNLEATLQRFDIKTNSYSAFPEIIASIQQARLNHRSVLLVSESPDSIANIKQFKELFSEIINKEDALERFIDTPYELITGFSTKDSLRKHANWVAHPKQRSGRETTISFIRSLRPHQWSKNLLIFMPLLASHSYIGIGSVFFAFITFCLTASSVYIFNDLLDLDADRAHARKRNRPFASGELPIGAGLLVSLFGVLIAFSLAALSLPFEFFTTLLFYYLVTMAYSLKLKRLLVIDVITLAGLYTLRIIAGAEAGSIELTPWMLAFSMFLFLSLASLKRYAELVDLLKSGARESAGRAYVTDDLPVVLGMALASGYSSVLVLALYISSSQVIELYESPAVLWMMCPVLLFWISRMVMVTHRGRMLDDPIVYAAKDRTSQVSILLCVVFVIWAAFV